MVAKKITEGAVVFLFCALVVLFSLGVPAWLVLTGQAMQLEGIFLILTCLVTALVFAYCIKILFRG